MNADRLLALYERIVDAPDAIARLRRFILDLAVRGRLVPQDPNDEPADIQISADHRPAGLPDTWHYTRLARLLEEDTRNGYSRRPDEAPGGIPILRISSGTIRRDGIVAEEEHKLISGIAPEVRSQYALRRGDLLACRFNGNKAFVGRLTIFTDYLGIRPIYPDKLIRIRVNPRVAAPAFVRLAGGADIVRNDIDSASATTVGNWGISASNLTEVRFPLPPLAEQHRIVAKVDELMALCDRLEAARTEREATRDRLTAASLACLNAPDPDPAIFADHASFALNVLKPLTMRPDQIKQLRQSVLNLAIRGKLVPQDPNDDPASELLREIGVARKRLYAEKKIPKPKELPFIDETDLPFSIPVGWAWSMLGELCYQVSDGPHFSPQYVAADQGVPFLSTRNIRSDGFDLSTVKYVSYADHAEFCKRIRPEKGDIIYTKGGTTGIAKVNDLDVEFSVWVHLAVLRIEKKRLCPRYVEMALNSPHCYDQSQRYTQGTSNFDLGLTRMIKISIPIPPLAEQHRIVAKVDQLMALCDRLEASLTTAADTSRRLLEALIAEALEQPEAGIAAELEKIPVPA